MYIFLIIVVYLFFSHSIGEFSKKKGLSYLFGFLLSFFISPFFGYIVVSIRKEQLLKEDSKNCPYCYNKIHVRSIKCIHCKEVLVEVDEIDEFQKNIDTEIFQKKEQDYKDSILGYVIIFNKIKRNILPIIIGLTISILISLFLSISFDTEVYIQIIIISVFLIIYSFIVSPLFKRKD